MSYTRIVNYVRLSLVRGVEFDHTHADRASSLYALMHSGTGERAYSMGDPPPFTSLLVPIINLRFST